MDVTAARHIGVPVFCHRYTTGCVGRMAAWYMGGQCPSSCPVVHWLISLLWLALLGLWLFGFVDWLPVRHARGVTPGFNVAFIGSVAPHALMPALTLVIVLQVVIDHAEHDDCSLGRDYIHYAQARGIRERRVFFNYAVRNSTFPASRVLDSLRVCVVWALLTEIVFSYPGQGFLLLEAVQTQDYPLLQGLFLTITSQFYSQTGS